MKKTKLLILIILLVKTFNLFSEEIKTVVEEKSLTGNWKYGLSVRIRPEMRLYEGFQKEVSNEFVGQRTWISLGHKFSDQAEIFATLQDSRIWGGNSNSISAIDTGTDFVVTDKSGTDRKIQESASDIREAYFYLENFLLPTISLKFGRQKIVLGDQRLVGHLDWLNTGRSFDAFLLKQKAEIHELTFFGSIVREGNASEPNQILRNNRSAFDNRQKDTYFAGLYETLNFGFILTDLYAFSRVDYETNELHTAGMRLTNRTVKNKLPEGKAFDWSIELCGQTGFKGDKKVEAYAFGLIAGYKFGLAIPIRLGISLDHASGDRDPTDKKHQTFDNLYHTNHIFYGNADQISWQNMSGASVDVTLWLVKQGWLKMAYWYFQRASGKDAFYAVHGGATPYALGSEKLPLYHEFDIYFNWQAREYLNFEIGYSYLYRASALRDPNLLKPTDANMQFFYLMSLFSI